LGAVVPNVMHHYSRLFLACCLLIAVLPAKATHFITYYIYVETDYIQGSWDRQEMLEPFGGKYLAPKEYEELLGSEAEELVKAILAGLKSEHPNLYAWSYEVDVRTDSVWIVIKDSIPKLETVQNEITASLTLNSFESVTFQLPTGIATLTLDDVSIPYFDLVSPNRAPSAGSKTDSKVQSVAKASEERDNPLSIWLWGMLSTGFLIYILVVKRNRVKE